MLKNRSHVYFCNIFHYSVYFCPNYYADLFIRIRQYFALCLAMRNASLSAGNINKKIEQNGEPILNVDFHNGLI